MAEILGPATIQQLALPTGVDGDRIAKWQLRDGTTFEQSVNALALAVGDLNNELVNKWGWWFTLTEEPFFEYEQGQGATALQEITDVDSPDNTDGKTIGHMIDLRVYGGGMGGTRRFFRDARQATLFAKTRVLVRRAEWRFELSLFNRAFTNTENAIGSGYDVPFVRGTGGNVDYVPPAYSGEIFTSSHDHFLWYDSASKTHADVLEGLVETLVEHGHMAPFESVVSKADVDAGSYRALTNYIEMVAPSVGVIDGAGLTSVNRYYRAATPELQGIVGQYNSRYGLVNLRASARVPAGYAHMSKSYGQLDARNSLGVRVHPAEGFGLRIIPVTSDDNRYPIEDVKVEMEYGVSVGEDRTNGASAYIANGISAWANPTIV